jgi:hypothetical protein
MMPAEPTLPGTKSESVRNGGNSVGSETFGLARAPQASRPPYCARRQPSAIPGPNDGQASEETP